MTISINTSDYIKYKKAKIDGVELGVRAMSSAEVLEITNLQKQLQNDKSEGIEVVQRIVEIMFGLYDKPEEARKVLNGLSVEALSDIYQNIMNGE